MPDPFSIAGTSAGLISLGIQVTQTLVKFYNAYKSQDSTLAGIVERLESLSDIFQCLERTLLDRNVQTQEQSIIKSIEISIKRCDELIHELQDECQKFHKTPSNGIAAAVRVAGRRAAYPFRQSTIQKLDEGIGEIRDNLSSALDVLQLKDSRRIQDSIAEVKGLLELVRTHQVSSDICDWLKAPDAMVNHNAACAKKHPGTGMWLVQSPVFSRWLTEPHSFLWLNGFAGSGKSVLCSTAIQFAMRHRGSDPSVGVAFFYFTFNDESKQDESGMLRALLLQLSCQLQDGEADLARLHNSYKTGIPPSLVLIEYLRRLIQRFQSVYIALDGLDESSREGARECVLDTLNTIRNWSINGLHLFVTSRDEPDIRNSLGLYNTEQQIVMRNEGIDKDIADSISARLDTDQRLRKWLPHRDKIQETLTKRAKGVFRWVECQFRSLQSCPRSEDHLDHLLNSLPQSLDETYERMLCSIDHPLVEDARRMLTLLCYAARPLTVRELIDGVAVKVKNPPGLNYKRRLQDFEDLHTICPGFIDINVDTDHGIETYSVDEEMTPIVQIAHYSVQEYLESKRIQNQKAAIFSMSSLTAHLEIAQICLVYLLEYGLSSSKLDLSVLERYPLALFAATHWNHHYQNTKPALGLDKLILELFQHEDSFTTWVKLQNVHRSYNKSIDTDCELDDGKSSGPVYYASLLGLDHVLNGLIKTAFDKATAISNSSSMSKSMISELVNAQSGDFDNPLQTASWEGHEKVVQILLDNGADVNVKSSGLVGAALQAASRRGYEKIVKLLLDKKADVNAQGGPCGNALQAASNEGYEKVTKLLLDKGADINARNESFGNALRAASYQGYEKVVQLLLDKGADVNGHSALHGASLGGYEKIVQLLLDKGADVNAQNSHGNNAIQTASSKGHEKVIQLLLDKGADVNAINAQSNGIYGTALQAASSGGYEKVIQLLLDKKADVNAQSRPHGNALQAASIEGYEKVIQVLLDKGADVNARGGPYGNALQAASNGGYEKVIQLLLDKGADINAQGGKHGNSLQAASYGGYEKVTQLLLEKGADINAQGGKYGNALQAASYGGYEKVAQLLLEKGADVNAQGGEYNNALQAALYGGKEKMLQLLMDKRVDVNARGGKFSKALQAASIEGYEKIIQLLLDKGADVNAEGDEYGSALQLASWGGSEKVVQLLLDRGAQINAQGGYYGNALYAASERGKEKLVQLLLDKGADVNSQGGFYGNALQAASSGGYDKVVQLLLDKGADVNAQGGLWGNALQAASVNERTRVVKLLLVKGANVNPWEELCSGGTQVKRRQTI